MNTKLLRPADFNEKLRIHGVDKYLTVQRICKVCKDEKEIRQVLDEVWNEPSKVQTILAEAISVNKNVFKFEQVLVS